MSTALFFISAVVHGAYASDFAWETRLAAVNATVKIKNITQSMEGSGVILGKKGAFIYILTAAHGIHKMDNLEVAMFSRTSSPRPAKLYRTASVIALTSDVRDLAVIRVTTDDPLPGSLALCPERHI